MERNIKPLHLLLGVQKEQVPIWLFPFCFQEVELRFQPLDFLDLGRSLRFHVLQVPRLQQLLLLGRGLRGLRPDHVYPILSARHEASGSRQASEEPSREARGGLGEGKAARPATRHFSPAGPPAAARGSSGSRTRLGFCPARGAAAPATHPASGGSRCGERRRVRSPGSPAAPPPPSALPLTQRAAGSPPSSRAAPGSSARRAGPVRSAAAVATWPPSRTPPWLPRPGTGLRSLVGLKTNSTNKETYKIDDPATKILTGKLTTIFLPMVYIIVFIIGLPSNALALWVFFFRTKKKHPAVIYMANLALADLLFVIWFPLKIAYHINGNNWIYGEVLCKILVGFFYGNMYCSILFMTCLSVQRYWVIANPILHSRKKSEIAIKVSAAIWILLLLGTMPLYLINQTVYIANLNITTCHDVLPQSVLANDMFNYFLSLAIGVFLFPAILTTGAYILMIKTLNASITDVTIGKKRRRAIKLIITVLSTYLICFLPSNILLVVHYAQIKNSNIYALYITALCLSTLNSCIDPFIYYFISKDFRDNVKNALLCRSVRTTKRMQVSLSSNRYPRKSPSYSSSSNTTKSTY